MLYKYMLAENLKHKHSILKKLMLILPLVTVLLSFVLMQSYFTINAFNWWYAMIMPVTFALIQGLMHRKEDKKLKYRAIYSLPVSLTKVWIAKVLTALLYIVVAALVHLFAVYILQFAVGKQLTSSYVFTTLFSASVLLVITYLWQIPFCFFLVKKLGFIVGVASNVIIGLGLGVVFADSSLWMLCPYTWGIRLMIPILKVLPNGLPVTANHPLIENTSILIPVISSVVLFGLITMITAKWFSRIEVK